MPPKCEFTNVPEYFLDEAIPLMQWENFEHLLNKPNRSEARDESVYQDFRTLFG